MISNKVKMTQSSTTGCADMFEMMSNISISNGSALRCKHIFKSGKNIGKQCLKLPRNNDSYCYTHFCPEISLKDFKFISSIGKGEFGKVFIVEKIGGNDDGFIYAMKIVSNVTTKTANEFTVLKKNIDSPFFIKLHYSFKIKNCVYFVTDFIQGGDLFTYLSRNSSDDCGLQEKEVVFIVAQIILGIEELHNHDIIYRDLKLENVLIDSEGNIVLADFGLTSIGKYSKDFCGTYTYMAPEIFERKTYSFAVDWYSMGVLVLELITGQSQQQNKLIPNYLSYNIKDLLNKLLDENPYRRLGSKGSYQIKNHPFFQKIDWEYLAKKLYKSPLSINVGDKYDISNFEEEFTNQSFPELDYHSKITTSFYFTHT